MAFWTGTMFLGKVEAIGEESIQTKLFILGVPLLPVSSWFVVREQFRGVQGFEIPLHGRSVGLAHLRMVGAYVLWDAGSPQWSCVTVPATIPPVAGSRSERSLRACSTASSCSADRCSCTTA